MLKNNTGEIWSLNESCLMAQQTLMGNSVFSRDETIRPSLDTIRIDTKGCDMNIYDTIRVDYLL